MGNDVAVGPGGVYITGYTYGDLVEPVGGTNDAFVAKYDAAGNQQWVRQIGSHGLENSHEVALDQSGNVYIGGTTTGNLGGPLTGTGDAFVAKYDEGGTLQWTTQFGPAQSNSVHGLAVDSSGNIYAAGVMYNPDSADVDERCDSFLSKWDSGGNFIWLEQFDPLDASQSNVYGVAVDQANAVYVTGSLIESGVSTDAFLAQFDADGNLFASLSFPTPGDDYAKGVAVDNLGHVYVTGEGINNNPISGFLVSVTTPIPEPSTFIIWSLLGALGITCGWWRQRRAA